MYLFIIIIIIIDIDILHANRIIYGFIFAACYVWKISSNMHFHAFLFTM